MHKRQCMKETEKKLVLEGEGDSIERAYSQIFAKLRKQIYSEVDGLIIHMEPTDVFEIDLKKHTYTEKFLGLFMPKEKTSYFVKAEIVVFIKYI